MPGVRCMQSGSSRQRSELMDSAQNTASGFQNLPEDEIERLVKGLDSLVEGDLAVPMLVACGERAVAPLRRFLLHGRPSVIFAGRQRAI